MRGEVVAVAVAGVALFAVATTGVILSAQQSDARGGGTSRSDRLDARLNAKVQRHLDKHGQIPPGLQRKLQPAQPGQPVQPGKPWQQRPDLPQRQQELQGMLQWYRCVTVQTQKHTGAFDPEKLCGKVPVLPSAQPSPAG